MKKWLCLFVFLLTIIPFCLKAGVQETQQVNVRALVPAPQEETKGGGVVFQDTTPPKIFNIKIGEITSESVLISWQTDEPSIPQINYGRSKIYEKTIIGIEFKTTHKVRLKSLLPDTLYHFEIISADKAGNRKSSGDLTFKTLPTLDLEPPANVSNLKAVPQDGQIFLEWQNPPDKDFAGIKIQRKEDGFPQNPFDGETVFKGSGKNFIDKGLKNGKRYFYTIFSFDKAGNFSSGALISAIPQPPILKKERPPKEIPPKKPTEIIPKPLPVEKIRPGQILPLPQIPSPTVNEKEKRVLEKIDFDIFQRKIEFSLSKPEFVKTPPKSFHYLGRTNLKISLPAKFLPKKVKSIILLIKSSPVAQAYQLKLDKNKKNFETTITTPPKKGKYEAIFLVEYQDRTRDVIKSEMLLDPYGYVYKKVRTKEKNLKEKWEEVRIEGAEVTLFWFNQKKKIWEKWPAKDYNQKNPQITDKTGEYAFLVPNGKYYLRVEKEGYLPQKTRPFEVKDFVVNLNIELIPRKTALRDFWQESIIIFSAVFGVLLGIILYLLFRKRKASYYEKTH